LTLPDEEIDLLIGLLMSFSFCSFMISTEALVLEVERLDLSLLTSMLILYY
jgi:hypothetical protein